MSTKVELDFVAEPNGNVCVVVYIDDTFQGYETFYKGEAKAWADNTYPDGWSFASTIDQAI